MVEDSPKRKNDNQVLEEDLKRARAEVIVGITQYGNVVMPVDPEELHTNRLAELHKLESFGVFEPIDGGSLPEGVKVINRGWVDKHEKSRPVGKECNIGHRDDVCAYIM